MFSKSVKRKVLLGICFIFFGHARADTIHIQNWPVDLNKVPCDAWKTNPDGSVTQTGTIIADDQGLTLTKNTFRGVDAEKIKKLCPQI